MKAVLWWVGAITFTLTQTASAQFSCPCGGGGRPVVQPGATFFGKTVCAARGSERWQEYHAGTVAGGDLIDWKRGPNPPETVDPTTKVGTWSATTTTLTHDYGPGAKYTWLVCKDPAPATTYRFCQGANAVVSGATLRNGQVPCP